MNPAGRWPRYARDIEGAWHAVDDLRDIVAELLEERDLMKARRFSAVQVAGMLAAVAAALVATCALILTVLPRP